MGTRKSRDYLSPGAVRAQLLRIDKFRMKRTQSGTSDAYRALRRPTMRRRTLLPGARVEQDCTRFDVFLDWGSTKHYKK